MPRPARGIADLECLSRNVGDQQLATKGLSIPVGPIASLLHRVVRHFGATEPLIHHPIRNDNESLAHPNGDACDSEGRHDRPRLVGRQIPQIDAQLPGCPHEKRKQDEREYANPQLRETAIILTPQKNAGGTNQQPGDAGKDQVEPPAQLWRACE